MWSEHFDEDEVDELDFIKIEITFLLFFYFLFYYYFCLYYAFFLCLFIHILVLYGSRNLNVYKEMNERREDVQLLVYLKRFSAKFVSKNF